jgi:hypothetical protein
MFPLIGHLFLGEEKNSWVKKNWFRAGLPDGLFSNQKSQFG